MTSQPIVMPFTSGNKQPKFTETENGSVASAGKLGTGREAVDVKKSCENGYRASILLTEAWERSLLEFRPEKKDGTYLACSGEREITKVNTLVDEKNEEIFVDSPADESLSQPQKELLDDSCFDNASPVNNNSSDRATLLRQNSGHTTDPECSYTSLQEELRDPLSHLNSHESRATTSGSSLLDGDSFNDTDTSSVFTSKEPLGQCDSNLETVLPADKGDMWELDHTYSTHSETFLPYSVACASSSIISESPVCPCDDCLLGLTDLIAAQSSLPKPKKPSNWRKVRNIVQWAPFVQTYKRNKYPWVQLAGHHGNFKAGSKQGTILKKLCPTEEKALDALMTDALRQYVPQFIGVIG